MKHNDIAVIGMAGKYPKAETPAQLWEHILARTNLASTLPPKQNYVNQYFAVDRIGFFDHKRFKFTPLEAQIADPQHRILLTCVHQALVDAGYPEETPGSKFGVFATTSLSTYLLNVLLESEHYNKGDVNYPVLIGNDKDFIATKIAYKLNLTGPALTIQCACSSSLVAMHHACQSLLSGESDLTVVGGVSLSVPQEQGYYYKEEGILSPDGVCRPFDASSNGTIKGNGCSVLILKRLGDAVRDRDRIYAVVQGTAVNNDGANKVGYTAPSILGQSECIQKALSNAGIGPEEIDYIETHGTGTKLGDLIELAALSRVFGGGNKKIPLGSLKGNIGHLDVAAGLSSVIKLIHVLQSGIVPPIPHFRQLNPELEEAGRSFDFPAAQRKSELVYGSVSSFGMGGTNAHAILRRYENPASCRPRLPKERYDESEFWVRAANPSKQAGDTVLQEVIAIWSQAIGEPSIQADTSYAELGGDSLTALEIIDQIKKRFSIAFALSDFTHDSTPRDIAMKIPSSFMPLRKSANGHSIFLFHPAGGTTFCYYAFARSLKGDYNVYAIDLPAKYAELKSMEELARHYLDEVKKIQPNGPYWLGGYSFGGNLAYEMAAQLQESKETVSKLIFFDSHVPEAYTQCSSGEIDYKESFTEILSYFQQKHPMSAELLNDFYVKWIYSHRLLKKHDQEKQIYSDIILFEAEEKEDSRILEKLNIAALDKGLWKARAKGAFKKRAVAGNHYTLFDAENVGKLSEYFDEEMVHGRSC